MSNRVIRTVITAAVAFALASLSAASQEPAGADIASHR